MRKTAVVMFLTLMMLATLLPMTAMTTKADIYRRVNLKVNQASIYWRHGPCDYEFKYQIRNTGPDDMVNEDFYDQAFFKESGEWCPIPSSIIWHYDYDLGASENSIFYYWRADTPYGWTWWCQCTDEGDDVEEQDETDNCLLKLSLFI